VTRDKWQVTGKTKPLYRKPPPKPSKRASGILPEDPSLNAKLVLPAGCRQHVADLPHAHPIAPSHFTLREDGSISPALECGDTSPLSKAQTCLRTPQNPPPSTLDSRPSTMPPRLAFTDPARGIRLYHGNSLELLDAIAAKYPDGRFDAIFADPPYFLSNGGIIPQSGTK